MELLSQEQINQLEEQILENEAAKERGEAPPHVITKEQMKQVVLSLRAQRGVVKSAPKKGGAKGPAVEIDLGDLMGGS